VRKQRTDEDHVEIGADIEVGRIRARESRVDSERLTHEFDSGLEDVRCSDAFGRELVKEVPGHPAIAAGHLQQAPATPERPARGFEHVIQGLHDLATIPVVLKSGTAGLCGLCQPRRVEHLVGRVDGLLETIRQALDLEERVADSTGQFRLSRHGGCCHDPLRISPP